MEALAVGPLRADEVSALAREAGFDLCGFARAEPIPAQFLADWLAAGMAADMDWMGAHLAERLDIRRYMPGAKTVVALACNYHRDDEETYRSPVSRYARGRDYHATLRDRLRALRRLLLSRAPTLEARASVDTSPVMEKVWAARAGLGYVGKNGCLITERYGSWVFLGTLILDREVDRYAGGPAEDLCGSCELCIAACPTGAIVSDRVVDARLCISYQTIENTGQIPSAIRPALHERVFGCDVCQEVCPLNGAPLLAGDRFKPRAVAKLSVRELAAMTLAQYQVLTPGTPLARAGYHGLRRNAAYTLGALRDEGARGLLELLSRDPAPNVAEAAAWALGQL